MFANTLKKNNFDFLNSVIYFWNDDKCKSIPLLLFLLFLFWKETGSAFVE